MLTIVGLSRVNSSMKVTTTHRSAKFDDLLVEAWFQGLTASLVVVEEKIWFMMTMLRDVMLLHDILNSDQVVFKLPALKAGVFLFPEVGEEVVKKKEACFSAGNRTPNAREEVNLPKVPREGRLSSLVGTRDDEVILSAPSRLKSLVIAVLCLRSQFGSQDNVKCVASKDVFRVVDTREDRTKDRRTSKAR